MPYEEIYFQRLTKAQYKAFKELEDSITND